MFTTVFGRYAARAPGALQLRTFSSRLGSTSQMLTTGTSASTPASAPGPIHQSSVLPSAYRSLHTSLSTWEAYASRFPRTEGRSPPTQNRPSPHLYIGGLPKDASEAEIRMFITEAGGAEEFTLRLLTGPDGAFRGAVFLDLPSTEAATNVKLSLIRAEHDMGKLWVDFSNGPKRPDIMDQPTNSIFVGLDSSISEEAFNQYMSRFDGLKEIRFGGVGSKYRAFVDFESVDQATAAVEALSGKTIEVGGVVAEISRCNFARPRKDANRAEVAPTDKLYIADVPQHTGSQQLEEIFSEQAGFKEVFSPSAKTWALAYFDSVETATQAFEAAKGSTWKGTARPIKMKFGTSRVEARQNAQESEPLAAAAL